jgi:Mrp family chromosome partitioning ATPase
MSTNVLVEEGRLAVQIPVGGGQRKIVDLPGTGVDPALTFASSQPMEGAAHYHWIAGNILHGNLWASRRIFISSPGEGDGKTSTAFNLAWALNAHTKSVLLVEMDFGRPRFRSQLGDLRIRYGIDSAIRGSVKPEESVFSLGNHSLGVAAVRDAMTGADIKRYLHATSEFLAWAAEKYEWILLDCPPVVSTKWNDWFDREAQSVLLVVREQHTPAARIRKAAHRLGERLRGVLLNDSESAGLVTTPIAAIGDHHGAMPDTDAVGSE